MTYFLYYIYSAWVEYDTQIWPYKEYRLRYGEKDKATALFREGVRQADAEYELLSSVSHILPLIFGLKLNQRVWSSKSGHLLHGRIIVMVHLLA